MNAKNIAGSILLVCVMSILTILAIAGMDGTHEGLIRELSQQDLRRPMIILSVGGILSLVAFILAPGED